MSRTSILPPRLAGIIPASPALPDPPGSDLQCLIDPLSFLLADVLPHAADDLLLVPFLEDVDFAGVFAEVGELIAGLLTDGDDESEIGVGTGDTQVSASGVDYTEVPGAAAVLGRLVGTDEGLALILVDEMFCGLGLCTLGKRV